MPLTLSNTGNGPLTWGLQLAFPANDDFEPLELREALPVEDVLNESYLYGVEFMDGNFYLSSGSGQANEAGHILIVSPEGDSLGAFTQPEQDRYGMHDLTFDGQFLWGAIHNHIYQFDGEGEIVNDFVFQDEDDLRNLAWDPDMEVLWASESITRTYAINPENGDTVRTFDRFDDLRTYGLAYFPEDPDGYNLYMFCRSANRGSSLLLAKRNTENGDVRMIIDLDSLIDGISYGLCITKGYDVFNWVIAGMTDNDGVVLNLWQLDARTDWLVVDPLDGVIPAREDRELTVELEAQGYPEDTELEADINISHDGVGGATSIPVSVSVSGEEGLANRNLRLAMGWNLVSLNVEPVAADFTQLVAPLVEEGLLALARNEAGDFYWPERELDDIGQWSGLQGYQFKVLQPFNIIVRGELIAADAEIQLTQGWNLLSYLPRAPVEAEVALSGLGETLLIARDGLGRFYIPAWDYSNIGRMEEGQGYQVFVTEDATLVYHVEMRAGIRDATGYTPEELAWQEELVPTGSLFSLLLLCEDCPSGTRVEAFTPAGSLAGRGVVDNKGRAGVTLWGDDPNTEGIEGFREGDKPTLVIEGRSGSELAWIQSGPFWTVDGWGVAALVRPPQPVEFGIIDAYPNPFNDRLTLTYALNAKGEVDLALFDISGRKGAEVAQFNRDAGLHRLSWDAGNLSSGVYLLNLTAGGKRSFRKVVLLR